MNLIAVSQDSNELMRLETIFNRINCVICQQNFRAPVNAPDMDGVIGKLDISEAAAALLPKTGKTTSTAVAA